MQSGFSKNKQFYTYIPAVNSSSTKLLLFLHGLGSSQNFYYPIARKFPQFNVLLIDHEGAGQSKLLHHTNLSLQDLSENVVSVLQELSLNKLEITLIGHSMSGMLVSYMNLFTDLPIIENVLIAPVHPRKNLVDIMQKRIDSLQVSKSLIEFSNTIPEAATGSDCGDLQIAFIRQLIQGNSVDGYIANCQAINSGINYDFDYARINKPTLIIYGKQDQTSPWIGCVEEIYKNLPNAQLKELDVGHWIVIEDDKNVYDALEKFLQQ
ncbi:conserved hypothetical protein [Candida albicans WO-1]|uniref:AB hydrolase-1 domain-containing protein n=1 Tax=Candida albicans (strain WO-1) TaxID=294748 RepID=C4YHM5_CANAW|nr:conserved hypothetical protein [Candida albicans WO-1]